MTRIANRSLDHLKRTTSVAALAESYGVKLKRHGASDLIGHCPLAGHAGRDRTASFVVSPKKNLWHCLGACQRGGSAIDLVMAMEGVSFVSAVKKLESSAVASTAAAAAVVEPAAAETYERDAEDVALLGRVAAHYHARLKESPKALAYLERRGIGGAMDAFRLGYADNSFLATLPSKSTTEGQALRRRLLRLGVVRGPRMAEALGASVIIPVFGAAGEVEDLYGRSIHATGSATKHRYLPGPHRGVFNLGAFGATDELIVCESLIDALTFWCAGFVNVTSSFGVSGFTPALCAAMKRHGTRRVLIAYDRDPAGDAAARKLASRLSRELDIACWRVEFPKGEDANSYARVLQPADRSLSLVLSTARWMGTGEAPEAPRVGLTSLPPPAEVAPTPELAPAVQPPPEPEVSLAVAAPTATEAPPAPVSVEDPTLHPLAAPTKGGAAPAAVVTEDAVEPSKTSAVGSTSAVATASQVAPRHDAPSADDIAADVTDDEVRLSFGDRRYRVRGYARNTSFDVLKVNLLVGRGAAFYVDTLDLYAARFRASYVAAAAKELGVGEDTLKADVGRVLLKLEAIQDARIKALTEPKQKPVVLSPAEEAAALELLRDPKLVERILSDFERCGVVGEKVNKLTGYLAAVSRKLDDPLAIVIQSSSAAGKTSLMEAVLAFMPEEDRVKYSAMTGQSLFYMGETDLKHKILAIVEEEGAERAAYALKLLQSEKELSIASTGKDPATGELRTREYRIEGPVMIFLTTTAVEIDEELLNRCILLTVDEDRAQTRAIHRQQRRRETLAGALEHHDRQGVRRLHQNAQRLLRPLRVANPHAEKLTFGDHQLRMRRDHMKYLCLIRSIALLHQHQRTLKQIHRDDEVLDFIEVELSDIALANQIARHVLARSLDELPPQTRRLLGSLDAMVLELEASEGVARSDVRFTRRDVIEYTGLGYTQLRVHLERLIELEHVLVHWGRRGQSFSYELAYDARDFGTESLGLAELDGSSVASLLGAPPEFAGVRRKFAGSSRAHRGAIAGPSRSARSEENDRSHAPLAALQGDLHAERALGSTAANGTHGANGVGRHPRGEAS